MIRLDAPQPVSGTNMAKVPENVTPALSSGASALSSVIPAKAGIQECRGGYSACAFAGDARTVAGVLRHAAARLRDGGTGTPRLDAEVLLMKTLGWSREDIHRHSGDELEDLQAERFQDLVSRRLRAEPVAYVTGTQEFWSLDFRVTPDVLIPRPETEHLVEAVLEFLAARPGPCRVLEIGTGSGAIAVCLARECAKAEFWATDVSAPALEVARDNAARHGVEGRIRWLRGDLFTPVRELTGWFDVLVSNPPYVPGGEIAGLQRDVRDWEPALALDGGADGMDFYRRFAREGVCHLRAGGLLAVEVGEEQGAAVSRLFDAQAELGGVRLRRDYAGLPRVVTAERTGSREPVSTGGAARTRAGLKPAPAPWFQGRGL